MQLKTKSLTTSALTLRAKASCQATRMTWCRAIAL